VSPGRLLVGLLGLVLSAELSEAQTEDHPPPPPGYSPVFPDLSHAVEQETAVDTKWFTMRLGLAPILDYTFLSQDEENVEQVGVQEDAFDVRSGRVQARGNLFADRVRPWRYLFSFEYKGFDSEPDETWNITDLAVTIPVGVVGELTIGKIKEPFVHEMVGDAANLPQVERILNPFFSSRNVGLRWNRLADSERMTFALGVFNDWWVADIPLDESGTQVAARMTRLIWTDYSGARYFHVGGAYRYNGADNGSLRYKGRPESNVTDNYVDTGNFPASHGNHYGLEALWNAGAYSVTAEYVFAKVATPEANDPGFYGAYVTLGWVVTGEHRPYDKKVGYARRVLPTGRWGSFELIARLGILDLDSEAIHGGYLTKWYGGLNWWATRGGASASAMVEPSSIGRAKSATRTSSSTACSGFFEIGGYDMKKERPRTPAAGKAAEMGVEAVELKITVRPDQELQALRALKLDEDSAEVRVLYFYDTPKLEWFNAGVALRARLVKGEDDDSTVKFRPVESRAVSREWTEMEGFKLEADSVGDRVVCAASLTALQKRDEIDEVAEGSRPIEKLFTKEQKRFLQSFSPKAIDFAALKPLGPIRVLRWKTEHKGFPYELSSEEWRLPDGTDLLEASIKVKPEEAEKARGAFVSHLKELGLDPEGAQETKTRTALEYFARIHREGSRSQSRRGASPEP
jgi:phosphate-selective porin